MGLTDKTLFDDKEFLLSECKYVESNNANKGHLRLLIH